MNFRDMTIEQLMEYRQSILAKLDAPDADLDALDNEARAVAAEIERRHSEAARREEIRGRVAAGGVNVDTVRSFTGSTNTADNQAALYRSAWLKSIAVRQGEAPLLGEMTPEERAAFTHTTNNTGAVVPEVIQNRIIELVQSMSPMLDDATRTNFAQGFGVPRHTGIEQGDAATVAEGTANEDEQDTFSLLGLDGCEIKKHVVLSRKMKFKSVEAFEDWLVEHLAARIAVAKEGVVISRLDGATPTGGTQIQGSGIDANNILTAQTYDDDTIRAIFGKMEGAGQRVIYANNYTIWNKLFGIADLDGHKLFVPNSMVDPIVQGRIYGATVKLDNNLANNVVYFGTVGQVLANDYDDLFIFSAIEPKTANDIKTGYALFDAGLQNPKAFVKATFNP